ncbi:L-aspartate oxidase [uncultured Psychrobacter sp.]|uniref:L-aspartate oxidase n=1 Tax=uncultured Psychrobacter sp. TaxID=259303 RepID=UPI00345AFE63
MTASVLTDNNYANTNRNINPDSASKRTDVLIIGAGSAGLSTALSLPKSLHITLLSKAALEACSSHYAQGGIAASLDKDDSVKAHIADTLIAGAGLCAIDSTSDILNAGQQAVQWLCEQGVPFTQTSKMIRHDKVNANPLNIANLHLTKEGGHSCRRVAHADDATGQHVMNALVKKAKMAANITILPFYEALSLITTAPNDHSSVDNTDNTHCQGAIVFDHSSQRHLSIYSQAVVLASGGMGKLFQRASAPDVCVGDGIMMAWQAGCRLANLEFVQFHPTGLAVDDNNFLISEALRGEGGRLYCPLTGNRFMLDIDSRAELAPRDIVARAIAEQISNNDLGYVHLDVSHMPSAFITAHFPQIYQTLLTLGIDITTSPIPVAPTVHYSCGGVVTCAHGLTDVQGLYAAGEVAYTGLHGANRLASNSLLECVVVGRNIAAHVPHYLATNTWVTPTLTDTQIVHLASSNFTGCVMTNDTSYISTVTLINIDTITAQLKSLMTNHLGIVRSAEQLERALVQLQEWQLKIDDLDTQTSSNKMDELAYFRLNQQLRLACLIIQSAYQRCESRGGHYRADYPNLADKPRISIIEPLSKEGIKLKGRPRQTIVEHSKKSTRKAAS